MPATRLIALTILGSAVAFQIFDVCAELTNFTPEVRDTRFEVEVDVGADGLCQLLHILRNNLCLQLRDSLLQLVQGDFDVADTLLVELDVGHDF